MSVFLVLCTIMVAGIAGGVGGAFLRDQFKTRVESDDGTVTETTDWWVFRRDLILGVLAAWVVPLFLVLAAPGTNEGLILKLMNDKTPSPQWWNHLLVLIGFCIIAALSAPSFLKTLSERILNQAKTDAEAARAASEKARKLAEQAHKTAETAEVMAESLEHGGADQALDKNELDLLKAIAATSSAAPRAAELAESIRQPEDVTTEILDDLRERGFVRESGEGADAMGWQLRGWGKIRVIRESTLKPKERKVLETLAAAPGAQATAEEVATAAGEDLAKVKDRLTQLNKVGLVAPSARTADAWRLRPWGREALQSEDAGA